MDDSEKPFACPSPGCSMSFTNEDHLVVHRKKHDMVLNLGNNGKNAFVADQTPTPTRFIRNCEEVGLFQDLQNVNPFDETFRRAVEAGKNGTLSESEMDGTDDTLHTPHIFPNIADAQSTVIATAVTKKPKNLDAASVNDKNHSTSNCDDSKEPKDVKIIVDTKESIEITSERVVVQETEIRKPPKIERTRASPNLSINGQEVQLLLKTADGTLLQLSAIPVVENRNDNSRIDETKFQNCRIENCSDVEKLNSINGVHGGSRLTHAKMRLKQALTKNGSTSAVGNVTPEVAEKPRGNRSNEKITANVEQSRKQDVLDRNRASSMRARAKRKAWIQQLQRTANNAIERNATLQHEVKALKAEVAKLRALLLAHDNCPVTKAMEKGSLVVVESNGTQSAISSIKNIRLQGTEQSCRKRRTNLAETTVAQKIVKSTRHPPILPKIGLIKDFPTLKINEIVSLAQERDTSKRIVLVENPSRKLEFVKSSSRSLIQTNPTILRIDNAASKCTGT